MSSIREKIKEKARDMYDIADVFGKNLTKAVKLDDVLKVLEGCVCDDLGEQLAKKMRIDIEEQLKTNGICENSDYVIIDKKQGKFVVVLQQKMTELADLLTKRPRKKNLTLWQLANPDTLDTYEIAFQEVERKFVELTSK